MSTSGFRVQLVPLKQVLDDMLVADPFEIEALWPARVRIVGEVDGMSVCISRMFAYDHVQFLRWLLICIPHFDYFVEVNGYRKPRRRLN